MKLKARPKGLNDVGRARSPSAPPPPKNCERLVSVAIMRGDDDHHGFKEHWQLRDHLGDERPEKPLPGDLCGFWTSKNRFVTRGQAAEIGKVSGQVSSGFYGRELLSSDVRW